jgi:hypothetical protein
VGGIFVATVLLILMANLCLRFVLRSCICSFRFEGKWCTRSRRDVLDPRRGIKLELPSPHPQHMLDGGKILLVDRLMESKFSSVSLLASGLDPPIIVYDDLPSIVPKIVLHHLAQMSVAAIKSTQRR